MAKAAPKKKANSAFMKPMQPSEHLAKIVGAQPLLAARSRRRFGRTSKRTNSRTQKISVKSLPMKSYSQFSAARNWTCFK
jgi:hypothetical protein